MTLFGTDLSDYDWGRGPLDIAAMRAAGISWLTHKATEGVDVRHQHYGTVLNRAHDAGVPVLGAYHVVRSAGALSSQVAAFLAYLDEATPWWRGHPNFFLQVDLERWPYDDVRPLTGTAFADLLAAAAPGHAVVIYASKGQYGDSLGGARPLWNANYPTAYSTGDFRTLYQRSGGDTGPGWASYSGRTPVMWQYTDSATIAGQPGCDANAFRGELPDLLALTGQPSGGDMLLVRPTGQPPAQTDQAVWLWAPSARPMWIGPAQFTALRGAGVSYIDGKMTWPDFQALTAGTATPAPAVDAEALAAVVVAAVVAALPPESPVDVQALAGQVSDLVIAHLPSHITATVTGTVS